MYKFNKNHQFGLVDFNQPMGMKMNPENRWVKRKLRPFRGKPSKRNMQLSFLVKKECRLNH